MATGVAGAEMAAGKDSARNPALIYGLAPIGLYRAMISPVTLSQGVGRPPLASKNQQNMQPGEYHE
jgi:hypothetical protein